MIKVNYISAVILLAASTVAHAQATPPATTLPGDQGIASVNKNLDKKPVSKGLLNASEQLEENRAKHAEQIEKRTEKREKHMEKKVERVEMRTERHEAMERPAKVERPGK